MSRFCFECFCCVCVGCVGCVCVCVCMFVCMCVCVDMMRDKQKIKPQRDDARATFTLRCFTHAIQCNAMQSNPMQSNAMQCNAIQSKRNLVIPIPHLVPKPRWGSGEVNKRYSRAQVRREHRHVALSRAEEELKAWRDVDLGAINVYQHPTIHPPVLPVQHCVQRGVLNGEQNRIE